MVEKRDAARQERDFRTADDIRDELLSMNVHINEKQREWSIGKGRREDGGSTAMSSPDGRHRGFTRRGGGSLTPEEVTKIEGMLSKRDEAKRNKQFGKADSIRDDLRDNYLIRIDDRSKEWMVVTDDYVMVVPDGSSVIPEEARDLIESKINDRAVAKLNKEYDAADAIRDELADAYGVQIDDRVREWTILDPASLSFATAATTTPAVDRYQQGEEEEDDDDEGDDDYHDVYDEEANGNDTILSADHENEMERTVESLEDDEKDLESLKVEELKERLREAGLPVSGRKAELIERLLSNT